jgi:hypothetical protein
MLFGFFFLFVSIIGAVLNCFLIFLVLDDLDDHCIPSILHSDLRSHLHSDAV